MLQVHMPVSPNGGKGRKCLHVLTGNLPILFMAGPIRNGPEWHTDAIRIVQAQGWDGFIASPAHRIAPDLLDLVAKDDFQCDVFERQRVWEQHYMHAAAENGCIMFWLCDKAPVEEFPGKVYAHITMLELGLWIAFKRLLPETRLVIGTDGKFPEFSTIECEIKKQLPGFVIHRSLEETVLAALEETRTPANP